MPTHHHTGATLQINRAPRRALWAAVVAERLGSTGEEALTLGPLLQVLRATQGGAEDAGGTRQGTGGLL
jgi:hypothetical protein